MNLTKKQLMEKKESLIKKKKWLASLIGVYELENGKTKEWVSWKAVCYLYFSRLFVPSFLSTFGFYVGKKAIHTSELLTPTIQQILIVVANIGILFCMFSPVIVSLVRIRKVLPVYHEINYLISEKNEQIEQVEKDIQAQDT